LQGRAFDEPAAIGRAAPAAPRKSAAGGPAPDARVSPLVVQPLPRGALRRLPLVTLYLTERCNSRCVTCDYWRHGRVDINLEAVTRLLPSLVELQTQVVLLSGGEPLLNPQWAGIAQLLRDNGLQLWLLTSGLSLVKHAGRVSELFEAVTVSLDGTNSETYAAIRGLDAFDRVCAGIQVAAATGLPVSLRVTVQRANYTQLPAFVELARQLGARQISFLAVDVANPHAFGRLDDFGNNLALRPQDLPELERILSDLERDCARDFQSGFIAESPGKLRRIHQYFSAVCGASPYPPVRCNAPEFSAVVNATGHVSPCFFIPGPPEATALEGLGAALNRDSMVGLRENIRSGLTRECATCVCSLWREPDSRTVADFLLPPKKDV
jgi:Fe-coproporphyrin III synthase